MRIISGANKGKKLFQPDSKFTRPLRDMVKESLFNLLNHSNKFEIDIKNSNVLDLFAGSGSFGLECISRGASNVYFFEKEENILKILKKNIDLITNKNNHKIFALDVFKFFKSKKIIDKKFDIIFIDPPFKELKIIELILDIKKKEIIQKEGIIIIHRPKKDTLEMNKNFHILEERNYGVSRIFFVSFFINSTAG